MAIPTLGLSLLLSTLTSAEVCSPSDIIPLTAAQYGTTFDATITFGDQDFELLVDTGSSDTWVLGDHWECVTDNGTRVPRRSCLFGNATYHPSSSFEPITQAWMGDQYGDGDAIGSLGHESVEIGSLKVSRQEIGVVREATTVGDSLNVGILGFGYPGISATHPNSHARNESLLEDNLPYSTIFLSLIAGGMDPFISIALERTHRDQKVGFGGYLGLGELPPVAHGAFARAPVEVTKGIPRALTNSVSQITEWTLSVESVTYSDKHYNKSFQAVVDVGNWLNVLPDDLAKSVNNAFFPPAVLLPGGSYYRVSCNATAPSFGVHIGDQTFPMDARDMIWQDDAGSCFSSVASGGQRSDISLMFLGAMWLKNVIAVFDMGKDEMRFAARTPE